MDDKKLTIEPSEDEKIFSYKISQLYSLEGKKHNLLLSDLLNGRAVSFDIVIDPNDKRYALKFKDLDIKIKSNRDDINNKL